MTTTRSPRRRRLTVAAAALLTATLVPGLQQLPAIADETAPPPQGRELISAAGDVLTGEDLAQIRTIGDEVLGLPDLDVRGRALPTLTQRRAVARLGDVELRWNAFGTPASILPADGVLARIGGADPVRAARSWLSSNAALFGITRAQVAGMRAIDQELAYGGGHAVFFRQTFDGLLPAIGSAVTVGVADGEIAYVSSSVTKTRQAPPAAVLTPAAGWLEAAESVGIEVPAADLERATRVVRDGFTRLTIPGLAQEQQVRLRALALADGSVRPVLEANVVNVTGGNDLAYTILVDAVTGAVLHRENKVENSNDAFPFTGSITATGCGPKHAFAVTDGATRSINVVASTVNPVNDITITLFNPADEVVASMDLLTSPEALTYTPQGTIPAGQWKAQVCPFEGPMVPFVAPGNYVMAVTTSDTAAGAGGGDGGGLARVYNPKWRYFTANPTLDSPTQVPRNSVVGCWLRARGCTTPTGRFKNVAAFAPWDSLNDGTPTATTVGNNANTHEAWLSPLTPGGLFQAPVSLTGDYRRPFTDAWNNSRCNPAELVPGGNDIELSVANLFVSHNRMHDYSYYLGFTERNYNLQLDNGGRGGIEGDQEIGNVQAGAIGGLQSGLGRDNANQITLQDGTPGITNQYLFQPIAGAFYAPCTDGGLDMGIVGHEYTHAISNRMVAGPDEGLTSEQGGAMGESWSDLVAGEYQFSHGYSNGGNVWAVGAYATGNTSVAIRDYAINRNPLNYSNYGFDTTGPEVHADGEIWNGTQWEVRQALVNKFDKRFPYRDRRLQYQCAQGEATRGVLRPVRCPGNRRWVQLMFDSFLLQQGATSMLDARDAMIAADRMRFDGLNREVLWDAFARRGMGVTASVTDGEDTSPRPSFASVGGRRENTRVTFRTAGPGSVYVGDFEARSTSVADTLKSTKKGATATFTPGRYDMLYVGRQHGFMRFQLVVKPGQRTQVKPIATTRNLAAKASGARVIRASAGSRNPAGLIDGSENLSWGNAGERNVDASRPSIDVDLAGGVHTVRTVGVSGYLRPAIGSDADAGSRFTALRRFAIEACVSRCARPGATWRRVFTSAENAFPSARPRPVAPTLNLRAFKIRPTRAAALRLVVLENQCTGFGGYAGDQDDDPLNTTDCKAGSDRGTISHVAELQAFTSVFPSWRSSYGIDHPQRSFR